MPLGESKYDSLQVKANKRYSHGLNLTATFTWQNERTNMGPVNNVFDHPEDQFAVPELSEPLITVVAFSYEVPAFTSNRFVRAVAGRVDVRRHGALRERPADSGPGLAEPDRRAGVPEHDG